MLLCVAFFFFSCRCLILVVSLSPFSVLTAESLIFCCWVFFVSIGWDFVFNADRKCCFEFNINVFLVVCGGRMKSF